MQKVKRCEHKDRGEPLLCTYTHLLHAQFSVAQFVCAHSHFFMRITHAHGSSSSRVKKVFVARVSYFSILPFLSHVSLLFLYIHFDITFQSTILPYFPVLEAQDMRHSGPPSTQVLSKSLLWTMTQYSLTIETSMKSLTSRKTHARTFDCSMFPQ